LSNFLDRKSDKKEKCHTNIVYNDRSKKTAFTQLQCTETATAASATWTFYRTDPPSINKDGKSMASGPSTAGTMVGAAIAGAFVLGVAIML
jgi:hypothetical protein